MNNNDNQKPLYKRVWFWAIIALSSILAFQTFSMHKATTKMADESTPKSSKIKTNIGHITTNKEKNSNKKANPTKSVKTSKSDNIIEFESQKLEILNKKNYDINFDDNSWNSALTKINNIEVIKTNPFIYSDSNSDKAEGLVILNISIHPSEDVNFNTASANLITNDGQQIETEFYSIKNYKENPDGEIANGVKKDGTLIFPIEKLNGIDDLTKLRLKFDASNNDDSDDHDYDMTINLNN